MLKKIKDFLKLSGEPSFQPSVKVDCLWQEIQKLPHVLTKKVVLINKYLSQKAEAQPRDGLIVESGVGVIAETKRIMTTYYFLMNDTPENQEVFASFVNKFMETHRREIIGIDEMTLEKMVVNLLHQKRLLISCAESCTGGTLISRLISVPGASLVTQESYITYSDQAKTKILGIKQKYLEEFGTVSSEVAGKMAERVRIKAISDVGIGVTGYTTSDMPAPEDGLFYYGISFHDTLIVDKDCVEGTRDEMRFDQTTIILWRLLSVLKE